MNENEELIDEESVENEESEMINGMKEQVALFSNLIKSQIDVKDRQIDRLHEELDSYRQENATKYVDQVMKGIIKIRKDMSKWIGSEEWGSCTIEDIKKECISQQKKLSINSCDITEENLYTDFLNEKKSEDILFNLLKNGRFSLTKDEKKLKRAFWAKYRMLCHGGSIGEGVFSEDNVFLYEQVLDIIW